MRAFIFDMDGCLLDSIGFWHDAEQRLLDMVGITLTKEERDHLNELTLEEAGVWFHEEFGVLDDPESVAKAVIEFMLESYRTVVEANPGVYEFINTLHGQGVPMCVLSSSPQSFLQAGLTRTDLKQFFPDELIFSADGTGLTKRNPSTFEFVCEKLKDKSWACTSSVRSAPMNAEPMKSSAVTASSSSTISPTQLWRHCSSKVCVRGDSSLDAGLDESLGQSQRLMTQGITRGLSLSACLRQERAPSQTVLYGRLIKNTAALRFLQGRRS